MNLDNQFEKLIDTLVSGAQQILQEQGALSPFAVVADVNGNLGVWGSQLGETQSKPADVFAFLCDAFRSKANAHEIAACGICLDVKARLPGYEGEVDAICCQLERADAAAFQLFVPYHQGAGGNITFDKPVALPAKPLVFAKVGDPPPP